LLLVGDVPASATGLLVRVGGFGPVVGAVLALFVSGHSIRTWLRSNLRFRLPCRWYVVALVLPPGLITAAGVVHALGFGAQFDLRGLPPLWFYPIGLTVVFFVGGGQEELGWRAFALPALQRRYSAFAASLVVGVLWTGWHLPLFVIPGSSQRNLPIVAYFVALLALSTILTWLYNSTGSVLVPMVLHAGINPIANYYPTGGLEAATSTAGYGSYALVLVGVVILLVLHYGSKRLAAGSPTTLSAVATTGDEVHQ
jgi:membrane protease YdiL (CAAX protease family)